MSDDCKKGLFGALCFLAGAAIGAGVALLYAPQSGAETRKKIKEYSEKITDEVREGYEKVSDNVKGAAEKTIDNVKKFFDGKDSGKLKG